MIHSNKLLHHNYRSVTKDKHIQNIGAQYVFGQVLYALTCDYCVTAQRTN